MATDPVSPAVPEAAPAAAPPAAAPPAATLPAPQLAAASTLPKGQGFRALTERWTVDRIEKVMALLHGGDRAALAAYLAEHVPPVPYKDDPPGSLDLKGLTFQPLSYRADLATVKFEGLNLSFARFDNVNLRAVQFHHCKMAQVRFEGAYLSQATVTDCDMTGADFLRSNLQRAKVKNTDLKFATWVDCELDIRAFEGGLKEELEGKWFLASGIYKALRLNLTAAGDGKGASWAAYRQSTCRRHDAFQSKDRQTGKHDKRGEWARSWVLDMVWGYGEKPARLFAVTLLMGVLFGVGYFFGGVNVNGACVGGLDAASKWSHLGECIYYSFITFTTVGYGDITPCTGWSRLLASAEAMSGIFTMSLFVTANVRNLEGR
jgi:hypothetical protein